MATDDRDSEAARLREEIRGLRRDVEDVKRRLSDELLTTAEAAKVLKMTEGAFRMAVTRGRFQRVRFGRRGVRFRRGDLIRPA